MSESPLVAKEIGVLQTLEKASAERARLEIEVATINNQRVDQEHRSFQAERNRITTTARTDTLQTKTKYEAVKAEILSKAEAETKAVNDEYEQTKKAATSKARSAAHSAKKHKEESRWQALAVYEAGKDGAVKQFKEQEAQVAELEEHLQALKDGAAPVLRRTRRFRPADAPAGPNEPATNPVEALEGAIASSEEALVPLGKLFLPKFLAFKTYPWLFLLIGLGLVYPLGTRMGWEVGAGVAFGIAAALAIAARFPLVKLARKGVAKRYPAFAAKLTEAETLMESSKKWVKDRFEAKKKEVEDRREAEVGAADRRAGASIFEAEARRDQTLREADASFPPRLQAIADHKHAALKEADEFYPAKLNQIQERFQRDTQKLQADFDQKKATTERLHAEAWSAMETRWRDALGRAGAATDWVNGEAARLFLDWHKADLEAWPAPAAVPPGLQFGRFTIDLAEIPQGVPVDSHLKAHGPTSYNLPAILPFPDRGSMLIKTPDSGKAEAVKLLQALMLRFLTSVPPGKVRFTIIDPVGLGENFAAFMHLGDYSELLINGRIWTEQTHIDQRTVDLTAHMENVIQKYLRNEFDSIEAYNEHAGEVAEPFRVLVAANFPTNWSENSARRLMSIASTGARCGVYTLISLDTKVTPPAGVQLKDLEPHCVNIVWREGKLNWRDGNFGRFPLTFDSPPDPAMCSAIMHKVGELAKNANRVEVPFEYIAPTPANYWTSDSSSGFDVPLGRAGATKLQHIRLGRGTSQHVLIAGKTGSGKSTLLHALITNAALRYSPDEVEMYLIDFKKGVEFKVYAALELPHAKVIAVESEREFGLSVLQRLDVELKLRGDLFRDTGVQDLKGFREATDGLKPMPRILLIVDEFQEFFVEDDKLAQEVALLLDRLVRQGRAFGIHVHLGSQSLGGAYSLARSTLGQMAVRIALQCSESDAHLILSEENSAARLLTRPGEAIYNDQNGMVEGNNFFQVVWLSDERREDYLRQLRDLARARNRPPVSQIVFEGNLPAVPSKNHLIAGQLLPDVWPVPPKADYAWLGEAIAIKDPTAAVFRPQSGSNLLVVGQNDAMALGMMAMAAIGLAAQHDPTSVRFEVLDGTPADSKLAGSLAPLAGIVPHPIRMVPTRDIPAVLGELAAEIERRQRGESGDGAPNVYLLIHDLQRFRDLRKSDDDFGFSSSRFGEAKVEPPAKLFANILRDGPPLGIHTIVWCDSLNNLNRTFERASLREFEMRVLFQMSANDSSTLIDAPAASRLGPNRGLYFSEEEGRLEKFRPYALPDTGWLGHVRDRFRSRPVLEPAPVAINGQPEASAAAERPAADLASDAHVGAEAGEPL